MRQLLEINLTARTVKSPDTSILVQKAQENTAAFTVKQGLLKQDHLCEAALLQTDNPAEVKYSPPGKRQSALIVAAKWSPESFQKLLYLQHNLRDISALIKKSLEKCLDIPLVCGPSAQLSMLRSPSGHCELLCLYPLPCPGLLWCPCMAESCPSAVMTKSGTFCADLVLWKGTSLWSQWCSFQGCGRNQQEKGRKYKWKCCNFFL